MTPARLNYLLVHSIHLTSQPGSLRQLDRVRLRVLGGKETILDRFRGVQFPQSKMTSGNQTACEHECCVGANCSEAQEPFEFDF